MNIFTKSLIKKEIKRYSNNYLKQSYLTYLRANGLNETQKECKMIIIQEMKKRGLL